MHISLVRQFLSGLKQQLVLSTMDHISMDIFEKYLHDIDHAQTESHRIELKYRLLSAYTTAVKSAENMQKHVMSLNGELQSLAKENAELDQKIVKYQDERITLKGKNKWQEIIKRRLEEQTEKHAQEIKELKRKIYLLEQSMLKRELKMRTRHTEEVKKVTKEHIARMESQNESHKHVLEEMNENTKIMLEILKDHHQAEILALEEEIHQVSEMKSDLLRILQTVAKDVEGNAEIFSSQHASALQILGSEFTQLSTR